MSRYKCKGCGAPATFYSKSKRRVRGDKQHDLCSGCWDIAAAEGKAKAEKLLAEWDSNNEVIDDA